MALPLGRSNSTTRQWDSSLPSRSMYVEPATCSLTQSVSSRANASVRQRVVVDGSRGPRATYSSTSGSQPKGGGDGNGFR